MPDLVESLINDLVVSTHPNEASRIEQMAMAFTQYHVMPIWFKDLKDIVTSGRSIQQSLMYQAGNAKNISLNELADYDVPDHLKGMEVPWARSESYWMMHVEEPLMNTSPSAIVDEMKARRDGAGIAMAELMENNAWTAPVDANDVKAWWGVPYWVTQNATAGFNGGALFGSTKAGVDPSVVTKMKNYTFSYTNATKQDLLDKVKTAMHRCGFRNPIEPAAFNSDLGKNFRLYVPYELQKSIESIGEGQNESLGKDVDSLAGQVRVRGCGVYAVDPLDSKTNSPIYGLNHTVFRPKVLRGAFMRESKPEPVPHQPDWKRIRTNLTGNFVCINPARCFVGYAA